MDNGVREEVVKKEGERERERERERDDQQKCISYLQIIRLIKSMAYRLFKNPCPNNI